MDIDVGTLGSMKIPAKRNHKKRHGVNRERSRDERRKHARAMRKQAEYVARIRFWRAVNRLYWSGVAPDFQTAREMCGRPTPRAIAA